MSDYKELKLKAEHAVGFTDISLAPDVVLDLIDEIERLARWRDLSLQLDNHRVAALWHLKRLVLDPESKNCAELFLREPPMASHKVVAERDQLRAELKGLRTGFDAQNEVIAGLRNEAERYRWLRKVTPYRFKKMQEASTTDGGDVFYFHADHFDSLIDAAMGKGGET